MKLRDKIEDKLFGRCGKCPFYYYEQGWEDCSEGCIIKGYDWDSGICKNMFLPLFILKIKYKLWNMKEEIMDRKYEKEIEEKCKKCKTETCLCNPDDCNLYK